MNIDLPKLLVSAALITLFLTIGFTEGSGVDITLNTDKFIYYPDDPLIVSGTATANYYVTFTVKNPNDEVVWTSLIKATSAGTYSGTIMRFPSSFSADWPMGNYTVIATDGYTGETKTVTVTFTQLGTVTGTVKDSLGVAVEGATVTLDTMSTTTDANGSFKFTDVAAGTYTLTINKTGYLTYMESLTLTPGESKTLTITLTTFRVTFSLLTETNEVKKGQNFKVYVDVDPGNYGVSGGEVTISFNSMVFEVVSVKPGDLLGLNPIEGKKEIDNLNGFVTYSLARVGVTSVPTPHGNFTEMTFKVKSEVQIGNYSITISKVKLTDENFNDIPNIRVQNISISVVAGVMGDINVDGVVDYKDLAILGASYGMRKGEPDFNPLADLNSDDVIDYKDLAILGANYGGKA